jgi:hypothetical protein
LNTQLKRKLLNKVIHKAADIILREDSLVEVKTEVSISSEKNNLIGLKLLWFSMQHMLDQSRCHFASSGVECAWEDPDGQKGEQFW